MLAAAAALAVTYSASYPASLFWMVNALAGDPHANTPAYRQYWASHVPVDLTDKAMLERFIALRERYRGELPRGDARDNSFMMAPPVGSSDVAVRFSSTFLGAESMPEAWSRAAGLLTDEDLNELRAIMGQFEPRFNHVWAAQAYLASYCTAFERYAGEHKLGDLLARDARFYGVPGTSQLGTHVAFVFTPNANSTHARQLGQNVVVEVEPDEVPADRADVVVHEISHYFFQRAGLEDDPAFYAALFEKGGADAAGTLGLVNEGLATAVGQGVIAESLVPERFRREYGKPLAWYNDGQIDRYAKAIFPAVKAAFKDGKTARQIVPELLKGYRDAFGNTPPTPANVLNNYMLVLEGRRDPAFAPFFQRIPPRSVFGSTLDEAGRTWQHYRGMPMVVGIEARQLDVLAARANDYAVTPPELQLMRTHPLGILTRTRPTGGDLFLVVAPDRPRLGHALEVLAVQQRIVDGWQPLELAGGVSPVATPKPKAPEKGKPTAKKAPGKPAGKGKR